MTDITPTEKKNEKESLFSVGVMNYNIQKI
jgi:hypothetical protein